MVFPQEKAQSVSWFIETKSDVQTQRRYRAKNEKNPPLRSSVRRWHKKFMKTGSALDAERSSSSSEISLQHVICKLFSFWLVIWLKSLRTFALCKHAIVTFCVEP